MRTYTPGISVVVVKRVPARSGLSTRVSSAGREIDITPFLGDGSSVVIEKDLYQPFGAWSITIPDRADTRDRGVMDTMYGIIEPMDYVELRMARSPEEYSDGLPIVMRGFVSSVRRQRNMTPDGRPRCEVVISGQDFGKLAQNARIFLRADYLDGNNYLTEFRLFADTGMFGTIMRPSDFMGSCVKLLNAYVARMKSVTDTGGRIRPFSLDASVTEGSVSPFSMQMFGDTLWGLMYGWADCPWNELFIEDRADGPCVVYRPSAAANVAGQPLFLPALPRCLDARGNALTLDSADIVDCATERGDANVANYFWVGMAVPYLQTPELLNVQAAATGSPLVTGNPDCDPALYGLRLMQAQTMHVGDAAAYQDNNLDEARAAAKRHVSWLDRRRDALRRINEDNVLFEHGSMTVKGSERLKPGRYVAVQEGPLQWQAYLRSVRHVFVPFGSFTTQLGLERGTNFIARTGLAGSPYFAEQGRGAYG